MRTQCYSHKRWTNEWGPDRLGDMMESSVPISMCSRCAYLECQGPIELHQTFYQLPLSPTSLDRSHWSVCNHVGERYMGQWCECCIGKLAKQLPPSEREFLARLADRAGTYVNQGTYRPGVAFSRATQLAKVGVYYSALNEPLRLQGTKRAHGAWGWPFAYDESVESPAGRPNMVPVEAGPIITRVLDAIERTTNAPK